MLKFYRNHIYMTYVETLKFDVIFRTEKFNSILLHMQALTEITSQHD